MKIDFRQIIVDHLETLRDDGSKDLSWIDISIFYLLPALVAGLAWSKSLSFERDIHSVSITFFGIFVALLLNVQVAAFAIFQRRPEPPTDQRLLPKFNARMSRRTELLAELNVNLSYLCMICSGALLFFLAAYAFNLSGRISTAFAVFLFGHFIMTLLMTIKRTHVLFREEYIS